MFSVAVSRSISICNSKNIDGIISGEKIIITSEKEALETLIEYFSRKINCHYCQTCADETNTNKMLSEYLRTDSIDSSKKIQCINTCYKKAVQVQIAEFFRSFDLNFDKKLTYHEFYKGFTSLFLNQTVEGYIL